MATQTNTQPGNNSAPHPLVKKTAAKAQPIPWSPNKKQKSGPIAEDRRSSPRSPSSNLFNNGANSSSLRTLLYSSIAFILLLFLISLIIIKSTNSQVDSFTSSSLEAELEIKAQNLKKTLDTQIEWLNHARQAESNPTEIINIITQSTQVSAAAIVNSQNLIVAGTPNARPLSNIKLTNFPQSGVMITSLIGPEGHVTPIIIQKHGNSFIIVGLNPNTLVVYSNHPTALIEANGRIISGPPNMGLSGAASFYNLPADRLSNLMKSGESIIHKNAQGQKMWISARPIAGSSLTLVCSYDRVPFSKKLNLVPLLAFLFLGATSILYMMMQRMTRQIKSAEKTTMLTEISQQRYRAAVDGNRGGIWEINLSENRAYVSASLAALLGMPEKEISLPVPQFLALFRDTDREKLFSLVKRSHISGQFEVDLGVARYPIVMSCRGQSSTRGIDNAKVVVGMALDVTDQRGAQARLRAAEARLVDALSSMNDSFVVWDQRDRLVLWNNKFEDFFKFPPGSLYQGLDHATIEYNANKTVDEIYQTDNNQGVEIKLKDNRWIRYLETPTQDGGRVSIGTDVTGIRTREYLLQENEIALQKTIDVLRKSQIRIMELAESYEQEKIRAEQASQSKSDFLANMSHELRTPLNAINGFSDIMKKEMFGPLGDERYKEYVNDILFSGQHLLSLINDILDMSKIEAGKMNLNCETLQMNEMILQVIRILRGRAEENRLKLVYKERNDIPNIEADARSVKQILLNLITNAIKFTPENGVVKVAVNVKSAGLIIRVSDTGIGISQANIDRLAKPFEQIDSQHSRKNEGTGLGLALSKSLVELHGGNFKIESVVDKGTAVTFTLPNKPIIPVLETSKTEVTDEISRLAQDIAEVLSDGRSSSATSTEPPMPALPQASPTQLDNASSSPLPPPQTAESEQTPTPLAVPFVPDEATSSNHSNPHIPPNPHAA